MQHLNVCMPCVVSAWVYFGFSGFDYISESRNMHCQSFSMISHAVDGWPHLRHPCAGISGSLSVWASFLLQSRTLPSCLLPFTPLLSSPPCPPLLAWSPWVFQPAMMALFHGLADGWPMTSYLGVSAVVYMSAWWGRKWHFWSLWHTICLTHPSSYCS